MTAVGEGEALLRLDFDGSRYQPSLWGEEEETPVLALTRRWVESFFAGNKPADRPPLGAEGTPFQKAVWQALLSVPYGESTTYGRLARTLATAMGRDPGARAVGQAVGHNPISLIVPCHRVLGAGGTLTGYAGGLERKRCLLALEQISFRE